MTPELVAQLRECHREIYWAGPRFKHGRFSFMYKHEKRCDVCKVKFPCPTIKKLDDNES